MDEGAPWEVEITDVFDTAAEGGVLVTANWVRHGVIRTGDNGLLVGDERRSVVEDIRVEVFGYWPPDGVALFLPGCTKADAAPGDRLSSVPTAG